MRLISFDDPGKGKRYQGDSLTPSSTYNLAKTSPYHMKFKQNLTDEPQKIPSTSLSSLLENSKEAYWCWDIRANKNIAEHNLEGLSGYNIHEFANTINWWKNAIYKDDRSRVQQALDAAMQTKTKASYTNEYKLVCKNDSVKIIQDHWQIDHNEAGQAEVLHVLMRDITEQKRALNKAAELEHFYKRQLELAVMDAQQNERKKLAEELHDNVNQLLGVVKLYIEHSITNEKIRDGLLKKSNQYIDKVIEELRNLSKNLAPPLLAELGLEHSVTSLAESIAEVQKINITVEMSDFWEEGLTDIHKLMVYRIVQEQLNNIIKHANASNAKIIISRDEAKMNLLISDDGDGAELNPELSNGLGLRNIRNRIELFHGKMDITTFPNKGFSLCIEFEI